MNRIVSTRWMRGLALGATALLVSRMGCAQTVAPLGVDPPIAASVPSGAAATPVANASDGTAALAAAIDGPQRSAAFRARDRYRHPRETLTFFGLTPGMTVVEIWPGNGWYTEILAPILGTNGLLVEALPQETLSGAGTATASTKEAVAFSSKLAAAPSIYGKVVVVPFAPPGFTDARPPGGADLVLTFRNVHNWLKAGTSDAVFAAMYAALKPGGTLGVVEHRARPGTPLQRMIDTGYVTEEYVIARARAAGFTLVARSEVNANPRDTTDHPHGVWSLPPRLAGGMTDRERFLDIGESDRMTLRFEKPSQVAKTPPNPSRP